RVLDAPAADERVERGREARLEDVGDRGELVRVEGVDRQRLLALGGIRLARDSHDARVACPVELGRGGRWGDDRCDCDREERCDEWSVHLRYETYIIFDSAMLH